MTNRIPALRAILLVTGFLTILPLPRADCVNLAGAFPVRGSIPQSRDEKLPLRCTKEALATLKDVPKFEYECEEQNEDNLKSPRRRVALKAYLPKVESSLADANWWATPAEDLNVCSIVKEARAMNDEERRSYFEDRTVLFGNHTTRLVVVDDPCIWYSAGTVNAYILQRDAGRVYATQVLNSYFTRFDKALDMTLGRMNGERLILVETNTSDGSMPPSLYTTCYVYSIDPRSHRAVPKKIFKEGARLTNEFRYDGYLFDDEERERRWHAPEIIRNGKLAPRFYVYTPVKHRMARDAYVWNGKCYLRAR